MYIDRKKHWQFLEDELKAETEEFKKTYLTTAISLLQNSQEMFVAQFMSFKDGEMILKFSNKRAFPRKGEFFVCMFLPPELQDYRSWGNRTYRDLYNARYNSTECVCIWNSPADDKRYTLVGFSKVSLDFANYIQQVPGVVLTLAPQRPPIDYVLRLQHVVEDKISKSVSSILDEEFQPKEWEPQLIKQEKVSDFVYSQLLLTDRMILEGPPGTGKTYMIAELCARLCSERKSVMVTALTNRALMEVAEKDSVAFLLNEHKIFKTNITIDEKKKINQLETIKEIAPMPGCLVLSTYFISSGFAAEISLEQPFDYVIMDEASQAILPMFAAAMKMGKKNLWVGDTHQLPPIVSLNDDRIKVCGYKPMVYGLQLLSDCSSSPIFQLTTTYRFGNRASKYTGLFYNDTLSAKNPRQYMDLPSLSKVLDPEGGPSLILTDMPSGNASPQFAIIMAAYIVSLILKDNKDKEVAVLTCMKKTTRALQSAISQHVGSRKNVIVETVARVQGLTSGVTVFLVPDYSYIRTLEPHLFNVATSRAEEHTIIIADKYCLDCPTLHPIVRTYLERLKDDKCIYVPDPNHGLGKGSNFLESQEELDGYLLS